MEDAEAETQTPEQLICNIGKQLAAHKKPLNKDIIVKLLRKAEGVLPDIKQSPLLKPSIKPLSDSLVKLGLLQHSDKDVKLLVAVCICEIIRILAPNPEFTDSVVRDIFELFIGMFMELRDRKSPYFPKRVKLLETVAKLMFCVTMLDTGCEDLVVKMFKTFFSVITEKHPKSLADAMCDIMTQILKEKVSQPLVELILQKFSKEAKDSSPASYELAVSVVKNCSEELESSVFGFLMSCISNKEGVAGEIKEFYHDIIFEIYKAAPEMLIAVIPNLTQELLTDQVDVRIKAISLIGRLFTLTEHNTAHQYRHLFIEFINRFSDKSAEVRSTALLCAKDFYVNHPSATESLEVLSAVQGRLLDFDEKVRAQAVSVACDLVKSNMKYVPTELISQAVERLRDKKVSVRKKALQKLLEVYREYCLKCSGGKLQITNYFEQIPCRILLLCYDKDCKEFGPQNVENVLAENLFPVSLSVEEKTRHWIFLFSLFTPIHLKALNTILSRKRRMKNEMQIYLALRRNEEELDSREGDKKIKACFEKMSACFPDHMRAEQSFEKLHEVKARDIFNLLAQLINEVTLENGQIARDSLLKKIERKDPNYGFMEILSSKCMFNIFSSDNVRYLLDYLAGERLENEHMQDSSIKLLAVIICAFPTLLRGLEDIFNRLLSEESIPFNEEVMRMLAKAGPQISVKLSDVYPLLERICLEGTRAESKLAVSAIASLAGTSHQSIWYDLYKTLMDNLRNSQNVPTVFQAMGCVAQHSVSTFAAHEKEITQFVYDSFFQGNNGEVSESDDIHSFDDTSECSTSSKLKIFGLKALVRSYMPHQRTTFTQSIEDLLKIISKILEAGTNSIDACEIDNSHVRLAAVKSVLQLSKRWDLHITPHMFHLTIMVAKDPSSFVRRSFIDKIFNLLKEHSIPIRYACAFAFLASDSLIDLQENSLKYMAEFIREYIKDSRRQTDSPVYIAVYLIHMLAHDPRFPTQDSEDEDIYSQFCSPLVFTLQALLNASFVNGDVDIVNNVVAHLLRIFGAIKKAEDALDSQKIINLHILADFGISMVNALKRQSVSMENSPNLVLLPSSLYKVSVAETREPTVTPDEDIIVRKLVNSFESQVSRPTSTIPKRGRKSQEESAKSGVVKCSTLKSAPSEKVESLTVTRPDVVNLDALVIHEAPKQNVKTKERKQHTLSSSLSKSSGLHTEFSIDDDDNDDPVPEIVPVRSSCDSIANKSDTVTKSNSSIVQPSKILTDLASTKETDNGSEVLIGQRINLWSVFDNCSYSGTVHGINLRNGTHKIQLDNGDIEVVNLKGEKWEIVSQDSVPAKDFSSLQLMNCDSADLSTANIPIDTVNNVLTRKSSRHVPKLVNKEKKNGLNRKVPLLEKENKRRKVVSEPALEVTDAKRNTIGQRTRSRSQNS